MARLILLYRGIRPTARKVKRVTKALRDEREKRRHRTDAIDDEIFGPIILQHIFAVEFGWSHEESGKLTFERAAAELEMILEDRKRGKEKKSAVSDKP